MKNLLLFIPLLFLLTACPIGLDHAPGKVGAEVVDSRLVGTWQADDPNCEVQKVMIKKKTANEYSVQVLERGEMYALETDDLLMYQTKIDDLNILYLKPSNENKYYLYQFEINSSKEITIGDISLLDGGVDAVSDTESLRKQISASKEKDEFQKIDKFVLHKVN
jgi:hypothetical protein